MRLPNYLPLLVLTACLGLARDSYASSAPSDSSSAPTPVVELEPGAAWWTSFGDARLDELVSGLEGVEPVKGLGETAYSGQTNQGVAHVFTVPESDSVISTVCGPMLCPTDEVALDLAKRAATKALDVETFVDDEAERPVPFVPRGNVKGRARRIWYPFDRFWLAVD